MWPLVSPPGVFKARNRAGRVRRHTSDMRDGHSGLCGGDKMCPRSHLRQGNRIQMQVASGRQARMRDTARKKEKKKKRLPRLLASWRAPDRGHYASVCVRPPSWRMSRDADGERRRGPACSAAPRAPRVKSRRGSLTHTHTANPPALSHVRTMRLKRPGVRAQGPRALWFSHSRAAPPTHSVSRRLRVAGRSCAPTEKEEAVSSLKDEDPRRYRNPLAALSMSPPLNLYRVFLRSSSLVLNSIELVRCKDLLPSGYPLQSSLCNFWLKGFPVVAATQSLCDSISNKIATSCHTSVAHLVTKCFSSLLKTYSSPFCFVPVQLLKSSDLGRHSLLYLKEIGHGWFGRVRGIQVSLLILKQ